MSIVAGIEGSRQPLKLLESFVETREDMALNRRPLPRMYL
jgi:hypothetical protein